MDAISKSESFQVIAFNKDGSQQRLFSSSTLSGLLLGWANEVARYEASGIHNVLPSYYKICVWDVDSGFTGLELPYIGEKTEAELALATRVYQDLKDECENLRAKLRFHAPWALK